MITMPEFLSEELESYIGMLYGLNENDRIFQISKSYLHHEMDRGVKLSGVKRIRIHDLRHSQLRILIQKRQRIRIWLIFCLFYVCTGGIKTTEIMWNNL